MVLLGQLLNLKVNKMTQRKGLIIFSSVVLVSVVSFIVYRRNENKKTVKLINDILDGTTKDPNTSGGQIIIPKSEYDALPDGRFPLKFATKSKKVFELQRLLNQKYGSTIDLDGKFGQSTASSLCKNYFNTCFTDVQSRIYEVTENDFANLRKK